MAVTPRKAKLSIAALLIVVLVFVFHYLGVLRPVENLAMVVVRPFQSGVYGVSQSIRGVYDNWQSGQELQTQIDELREQHLNDLVEQNKFRLLKEEVDYLRQQLDLVENNEWQLQVAHVIGAGQDDNAQTIIIDRGAKHNIEKDMPVITNDGIIVGKVTEVYDYAAIVRLLNDHNSQLAATVYNEAGTVGVAQGEFGLGVKMELIPENEGLATGVLVVTSGLEEKIPRGLVIGNVEKIFGSDEDIFKTATIKLPIDFTKLSIVSVITSR